MSERASAAVYDSVRLAEGYAFARPPVHPLIIRLIAQRLGGRRRRSALDVGCGAGLSTAALEPLAEKVVGLDPSRTMLTHRRAVAPHAAFVIARAESLPFAAESFDLITAAGSLNYANLAQFLPEAARLLTPGGHLIVYDFSAARRFRDSPDLDRWFTTFETRYPFPPGYDFDVWAQDYARFGLEFETYEPFEVSLPMTLDAYVRYAMSETNVEQALRAAAATKDEVHSWCRQTLGTFFGDQARQVLFDGYVAYVRRANDQRVPPRG